MANYIDWWIPRRTFNMKVRIRSGEHRVVNYSFQSNGGRPPMNYFWSLVDAATTIIVLLQNFRRGCRFSYVIF